MCITGCLNESLETAIRRLLFPGFLITPYLQQAEAQACYFFFNDYLGHGAGFQSGLMLIHV